ncbi:MAG: DUF2911 domain-containing protein [Sediminibacterium sp.]|jgi:Protein of unknown function (DUF2911)|uniref:DUF2911 domain-containing protein n=1 Tax=Sediminibacterium sp. TaxID=1917865 RepID=UPI002AB8F315|nr:DUF2911 domain-containing protein [Sediminibacterium sp.]MDZ4071778.1 DUF2911 domain-containing protein [Sediminibacterium sp.]
MNILLALILSFAFSSLIAQHQHISGDGYADSVNKGLIAKDTMKGSPKRVAMKSIGNTHIHIEYGSPGVKGRMIWGGLVAYDQVWATGAHNATSIDFSTDVTIGGKKITKGKYALFTIPGKTEWTIIINTNYQQHLADAYNVSEDIVRVKVKPIKKAQATQRLTYSVIPSGKDAGVMIEWEYLKVVLPIKVS